MFYFLKVFPPNSLALGWGFVYPSSLLIPCIFWISCHLAFSACDLIGECARVRGFKDHERIRASNVVIVGISQEEKRIVAKEGSGNMPLFVLNQSQCHFVPLLRIFELNQATLDSCWTSIMSLQHLPWLIAFSGFLAILHCCLSCASLNLLHFNSTYTFFAESEGNINMRYCCWWLHGFSAYLSRPLVAEMRTDEGSIVSLLYLSWHIAFPVFLATCNHANVVCTKAYCCLQNHEFSASSS